jgi:hypothetical protein
MSKLARPGQWIDLIAFLGVLALGGYLIAFGHTTAGALASICAALAGLYAAYKHLPRSDGSPEGADDERVDEARQPRPGQRSR